VVCWSSHADAEELPVIKFKGTILNTADAARYEIAADRKPRSYWDVKETAIDAHRISRFEIRMSK
jgi:hypothetical protein